MDERSESIEFEETAESLGRELVGVDLRVPSFTPRLLVADSDALVREIVTDYLAQRGLESSAVATVREASERLREGTIDILVLDADLQDGSAFALLDQQPALTDDLVVILLSWGPKVGTTVKALRRRVEDFLEKPFSIPIFEQRLDAAIDRWRSRMRAHYYKSELEDIVEAMTDRLLETERMIEDVRDETVRALGAALHLRDSETEEHCLRVSLNCVELARRIGYPLSAMKHLEWDAYLHDIGKIGLPEGILTKPGPLSAEERELMQLHPLLGFRMISNIDFLKGSTSVVLYHHERFDGHGYLHGLAGKQIPLAARVFAVIDAMDAMLYERPYRKAMSYAEMIEEIKRGAGSQFDPEIVSLFLTVPEAVWRKAEETADR